MAKSLFNDFNQQVNSSHQHYNPKKFLEITLQNFYK